MLTTEQEIGALKYARKRVELGAPYICKLLQDCTRAPTMNVVRDMTTLLDEVEELIARKLCVEGWLGIEQRYGVVKQYRLAIIDTLLARRGVF